MKRTIPTSDSAFKELLQEILDRIYRIENSGPIAGVVSFSADGIQIGDVSISVVDTGSNNRDVVLRNTLTGATDTIHL